MPTDENVIWEDDPVSVHGYDVEVGRSTQRARWYAARTKSPIFCLLGDTRGDALLKASLALAPLALSS